MTSPPLIRLLLEVLDTSQGNPDTNLYFDTYVSHLGVFRFFLMTPQLAKGLGLISLEQIIR